MISDFLYQGHKCQSDFIFTPFRTIVKICRLYLGAYSINMSELISQNTFFDEEELIGEQKIRDSDLNTDSSNYLTVSQPVEYSKKWLELIDTPGFMLDISTEQPFRITLGLQYAQFMKAEDDLNIAKVILGIKDNNKTYRDCIEFGLYMGRLFIGDLFDSLAVSKEKLVEGVDLVLTVHPVANGKSFAMLSAISESGSTLSSLISKKFAFEDWKGEVSPGAHFKSLLIEDIPTV